MHNELWREILFSQDGEPCLWTRKHESEQVAASLSKADMEAFFATHLLPSSPSRRALAVHVLGCAQSPVDGADMTPETVAAFHHAHMEHAFVVRYS